MNILSEIENFVSKSTNKLTDQAKSTALKTLNDPEIRASVNSFTREWFNEHKVVLLAIFGTMFLLIVLATVNIFSNFRQGQR